MVFRRFHLQVIWRIILLSLTCLLLAHLILRTELIASTAVVGIFAVSQVVLLIKFLHQTQRNLVRFFDSIRFEDFGGYFPSGGASNELAREFNRVLDDFRKIRSQREEQFRYLQTVVQHVGIGIITYDSNGKIDLINTSAKRILRVSHLRNLNELSTSFSNLLKLLTTIGPGKRENIKIELEDGPVQLTIRSTEFKRRGNLYTLVSIQDIQTELEEKELDAWQNITRVLTHEIRNSVAPIASLASTAEEMMKDNLGQDKTVEELELLDDMYSAVGTIRRRSERLLQFVEPFRTFYRIPDPDIKIFKINSLLNDVKNFFDHSFRERSIRSDFNVNPENLELAADPAQIEQILINLIKNACDALEGTSNPEIVVQANLDEKARVAISVSDNGPGIEKDVLEKIFVPFYTTKKEGSGIGLSFSRQIMRLHKGTLFVRSSPEEGTRFTLRF